jgi:hypothetical protein
MEDFNRGPALSERPLSQELNALIEAATPSSKNYRQYLGASSLGSDCLRKIQYSWMCDPEHPSRTSDIFSRGHHFEAVTKQHLVETGFWLAPEWQLRFQACDGLFRGHADGVLLSGPPLPGLTYPAVWECKCLKDKGWKAIARDGLVGLYRPYAAQVALYQHHLGVINPALFSVVNADTCERLHFTVPFDAELAQRMIDRAVQIIEATRAGELLPRITENPDDWRCTKMCPYRARCWRLPP